MILDRRPDRELPLKPERVQQLLSDRPGWRLAARGSALRRTYRFPNVRVAAAFVQLAVEVGEHWQHRPDLELRGAEVVLTLSSPQVRGLTELDFAVASSLELGEP